MSNLCALQGDGAIDVGKGEPTSLHAHAINLDALLCVWCSSNRRAQG